jgi:hypothetical protein
MAHDIEIVEWTSCWLLQQYPTNLI